MAKYNMNMRKSKLHMMLVDVSLEKMLKSEINVLHSMFCKQERNNTWSELELRRAKTWLHAGEPVDNGAFILWRRKLCPLQF